MEAVPNYYIVLGVPRYTSRDGIRRAYLRRAREHHPDLYPNDPDAEATMSSINAAYATLSDPNRRAEYDARCNSVRIQVDPSRPAPYSVAPSERRCVGSRDGSVLDTAMVMLARLIRYVTATLPHI